MWAPVVVKGDPVGNDPTGVLLGFEAMAVRTLVLKGADHAFDNAVPFRAMRRDELLTHAVALHLRRVAATDEPRRSCQPRFA